MKEPQFKLSVQIFIAFSALRSSQVFLSLDVEKSVELSLIKPLCKLKAKIPYSNKKKALNKATNSKLKEKVDCS